jgi:hypothetical protein
MVACQTLPHSRYACVDPFRAMSKSPGAAVIASALDNTVDFH